MLAPVLGVLPVTTLNRTIHYSKTCWSSHSADSKMAIEAHLAHLHDRQSSSCSSEPGY